MSLSSSIMSTKLGISFKKARSQIFHLCSTIFIMQKTLFWMFEMATNKFKNKNPSALTLLKYSDSLYCLFTVKYFPLLPETSAKSQTRVITGQKKWGHFVMIKREKKIITYIREDMLVGKETWGGKGVDGNLWPNAEEELNPSSPPTPVQCEWLDHTLGWHVFVMLQM